MTPNHAYIGPNRIDLTQDTNTVYTHPYDIQCNAINEINSLKSSVSNGKSAIASAITGKGVSTAADATFQTMANNIGSITTPDPYDQNFVSMIVSGLSASDSGSGSWGGTSVTACNLTAYCQLTSTGTNGLNYTGDTSFTGVKDTSRLGFAVHAPINSTGTYQYVRIEFGTLFTISSGTTKVILYPSSINLMFATRDGATDTARYAVTGWFSNFDPSGPSVVLNIAGGTFSSSEICYRTSGSITLNPGTITFKPRLDAVYRLSSTWSVPYANYIV